MIKSNQIFFVRLFVRLFVVVVAVNTSLRTPLPARAQLYAEKKRSSSSAGLKRAFEKPFKRARVAFREKLLCRFRACTLGEQRLKEDAVACSRGVVQLRQASARLGSGVGAGACRSAAYQSEVEGCGSQLFLVAFLRWRFRFSVRLGLGCRSLPPLSLRAVPVAELVLLLLRVLGGLRGVLQLLCCRSFVCQLPLSGALFRLALLFAQVFCCSKRLCVALLEGESEALLLEVLLLLQEQLSPKIPSLSSAPPFQCPLLQLSPLPVPGARKGRGAPRARGEVLHRRVPPVAGSLQGLVGACAACRSRRSLLQRALVAAVVVAVLGGLAGVFLLLLLLLRGVVAAAVAVVFFVRVASRLVSLGVFARGASSSFSRVVLVRVARSLVSASSA